MTISAAPALLAHIDAPPKLIASLVVLGIVLIIALFKWMLTTKPSTTTVPAQPGAPFCSTCGTQARWLAPQAMWGCDKCQKAVVPPQAPGAMPFAPPIASAPFAPPVAPTCPTCSGPGRWLAESNAWGCDRCRALIPTAAPSAT